MGMDTGVSFEMVRGIGVRVIGQTPALGIGQVKSDNVLAITGAISDHGGESGKRITFMRYAL